ncbi:hypothetical protein D3C73_1220640 [compost metagenome]
MSVWNELSVLPTLPIPAIQSGLSAFLRLSVRPRWPFRSVISARPVQSTLSVPALRHGSHLLFCLIIPRYPACMRALPHAPACRNKKRHPQTCGCREPLRARLRAAQLHIML